LLVFFGGYPTNLGSRLDYFDGRNLDDIIVASQGVVTINTTVGLRSLQRDRPVMVLGEAIYHIVGLTFKESVDEFWTRAQKPDPVLREAFIKVLCHYFQIRGTFYSEPGLSAAVKEMADRLYSGRVGVEHLT
jgi:capsular polysaccharide export protein